MKKGRSIGHHRNIVSVLYFSNEVLNYLGTELSLNYQIILH